MRLGFFTTGETLKRAETTSKIAQQSAKTPSLTTNELLNSITTLGVAAAVGAAAFASAIALTGAFAEGGFTGAGGRLEPAGLVHRGEYVFDQASVRRIGLGNLEAMQKTPPATPGARR